MPIVWSPVSVWTWISKLNLVQSQGRNNTWCHLSPHNPFDKWSNLIDCFCSIIQRISVKQKTMWSSPLTKNFKLKRWSSWTNNQSFCIEDQRGKHPVAVHEMVSWIPTVWILLGNYSLRLCTFQKFNLSWSNQEIYFEQNVVLVITNFSFVHLRKKK